LESEYREARLRENPHEGLDQQKTKSTMSSACEYSILKREAEATKLYTTGCSPN